MPNRLVSRLGEFDIRERLSPIMPAWASQIAFAAFCIGAEAVVRAALNLFVPNAAPFALIFPATMTATLFAGWQAGLIVLVVSELMAWYFVLNPAPSFAISDPNDIPRMVVIGLSGLMVIALADLFRRTVQTVAAQKRAEIAERDLLLREIDHRIRNNFQMVSALIDIQRRRSDEPAVQLALTEILGRIESFSRAHRHLYRQQATAAQVDLREYLEGLCHALAQALSLHGAVVLTLTCDDGAIHRDKAVSIGLIVNELVTNAAKHAFLGRQSGRIAVAAHKTNEGWRLIVSDDGVGLESAKNAARPEGGLGRRLVDAFVRQANGALAMETGPAGSRIIVDLPYTAQSG